MVNDKGENVEVDLDDPATIEQFLDFLPIHQQQYTRQNCLILDQETRTLEHPAAEENPAANEEASSSAEVSIDSPATGQVVNGHSSDNSVPLTRQSATPPERSNDTSATATPAEGRRAPPPTPASLAAALENGGHQLEPVPEDKMMDLTPESRAASPIKSIRFAEDDKSNRDSPIEVGSEQETKIVDVAYVEGAKSAASQADPQVEAVEVAKTGSGDSHKEVPHPRVISPTTATIQAFDTLTAKDGNKGLEASRFAKPGVFPRVSNSSRTRTTPLPNIDPPSATLSKPATTLKPETRKMSEEYQNTIVDRFRKEHETTEMEGRFVNFEKAEGSPAPEAPPAAPITIPAVRTAEDDEYRENATYFGSWGDPLARPGPKAEYRRVTLKGLPTSTDYSLVAALIHGGALESIIVNKSFNPPTEVTAIVTFTKGAPAKAYYDKYPNGLDFKFQGKKYVATVEFGNTVDVVSGVMRGYLESGATRVVRAAGADEEWAMRALRKIAEAKGRKVEAIVDVFTNEGRTINFRFSNIADAVKFRATLVRDAEWMDCNITFGEDPCEKASDIRKV